MRVVQLTVTPDADGVLRFAIPAGAEGVRFRADVVLTPLPAENGKHAAPTAEDRGWPPGWERVYGSVQDETFVEPPDLPFTPVEPLG